MQNNLVHGVTWILKLSVSTLEAVDGGDGEGEGGEG